MFNFLIFCFFPLLAFCENGCIPEILERSINSCSGEERALAIEFEKQVLITAESRYPHFNGDSPLIYYVNKKLEIAAKTLFDSFIEHEKASQEEYDKDFGGCSMGYQLSPVYCQPNFISIYGCESQTRACPHGWTHYESKNYWQSENAIIEVGLKDLFLKESGWCNFLLDYCDRYFTVTNHGYYASDYGLRPKLEPEDLNIFVITKEGLIIIFRSYRVGGWADGPDIITIPYNDLKEFIDPNGPLKEVPEVNSILRTYNV